ncbi:MAG: hypothetical protein PHR06_08060, partial [Candidatus Cloacimonetes bacterium]|nr:hypothetical protein [Candidatus Cloacimonadota bacterium]
SLLMGGTAQGVNSSIPHALMIAGIEVAASTAIGVAGGFILVFFARRIHDKVMLLLISLALILINCGVSMYFNLSPILINMAVGIVAVNRNKIISGRIFSALGDWSPPMYVLFFVLIGTRLEFNLLVKYGILIAVYIVARTAGKWVSTYLGATVSKAPLKIRKYLGFTMLSQAGVAIGLALSASKTLDAYGKTAESVQVISVMTITTFLIMLIGPVCAKIALFKANEAKVYK